MGRLSSPIDRIKDHYAVVVVGSGYGGAIAASRLQSGGADGLHAGKGKGASTGRVPQHATRVHFRPPG
jgi:cholesterol oxidase